MANKRPLSFSPAGMTVRNYRDNEIIFSQGDAADAVFHVQSGTVKLTVAATRRKKAIIAVLLRGSFFGEGCLAGQALRMYTARSIGHSSITRLRKESAVRTLKRDPKFARLFVAYLLARVIRVEEDLADQFFNFSEKRLARVLLMLAHFGKEGIPESVVPKISQETLAEMVGTTRSRVSFFMNRFRKLGFINYAGGAEGGLQVHSSLLSVVLHD